LIFYEELQIRQISKLSTLRGYPSRFATGKYLATGTLEYRAPIWYIFRGFETKPFFWDRLHGAVFADAGETAVYFTINMDL